MHVNAMNEVIWLIGYLGEDLEYVCNKLINVVKLMKNDYEVEPVDELIKRLNHDPDCCKKDIKNDTNNFGLMYKGLIEMYASVIDIGIIGFSATPEHLGTLDNKEMYLWDLVGKSFSSQSLRMGKYRNVVFIGTDFTSVKLRDFILFHELSHTIIDYLSVMDNNPWLKNHGADELCCDALAMFCIMFMYKDETPDDIIELFREFLTKSLDVTLGNEAYREYRLLSMQIANIARNKHLERMVEEEE